MLRRSTHHGYIEVYVGTSDPRGSNNRGWAYEHIVIAERHLGRSLRPKEEVHHKNKVRSDNRWANLKVCRNRREHAFLHRQSGKAKRRGPHQGNEQKPCGCGCGELVWRFDKHGVERRFLPYHANRLQVSKVNLSKGTGSGGYLAARTHCPQEHEYNETNTRYTKQGRRIYRTCHRNRETTRRSRTNAD